VASPWGLYIGFLDFPSVIYPRWGDSTENALTCAFFLNPKPVAYATGFLCRKLLVLSDLGTPAPAARRKSLMLSDLRF